MATAAKTKRAKAATEKNLSTDADETSLQVGLARTEEAAAYLSISRSSVYHLMDTGDIPYRKIGNSRRIPWAWLHQQAAIQ